DLPIPPGTQPALSDQPTRGTGGSPVQTERSSGTGDWTGGSPVPREMSDQRRHRLEEEVGDLFFVLVNIARHLSVDSESALRKTNRKFRRRFHWIEERLRETGQGPQQATMEDLESLWQEAKRFEAETAQ